jgi:drug/metabolite transporter (DMT)-like permease
MFGVTARMSIGAVCLFLTMLVLRKPLIWHQRARKTYFAAAMQIYAAMMAVYWGAQMVPSGWISVIFGLTPLMTALLAAIFLSEPRLGWIKLFAYLVGIGGLVLMFGSAELLGEQAVYGILAVLLAAFLQAASAVWVKRINAKVPAMPQVAGGLLFALPAYLFTWLLYDEQWPAHISQTTLASIVYLGVVATCIGFILYYYLLTHLATTRVALITLVTPVLSLYIGHAVNNEVITEKVILGTLLILSALLMQGLADRFRKSV